jgi:hypothetical protein
VLPAVIPFPFFTGGSRGSSSTQPGIETSLDLSAHLCLTNFNAAYIAEHLVVICFSHNTIADMHTFGIIGMMLLITSIIGLATWAAMASITYNWASEHASVKRGVLETRPDLTVNDDGLLGSGCCASLVSDVLRIGPYVDTKAFTYKEDG